VQRKRPGKKCKKPETVLVDGKNGEILGVKAVTPDATLEDIGQAVGLSPSAVSKRLKSIRIALRETDEVKIAIDQLRGLVPLCVAVYARKLAAEDRDVARDILKTHGLLVDRTENVNRNMPATREDILDGLKKLGTTDYDWVCEQLNATPEPPPTDA
jgi:DNA-binding Lrp family transcriptional regulator